jgi:hypothetical protein
MEIQMAEEAVAEAAETAAESTETQTTEQAAEQSTEQTTEQAKSEAPESSGSALVPAEKTEEAGEEGEKQEGDDDKAIADRAAEYDITIPEGLEVDQALFDGARNLASKHSLSNEALQEFADLQIESAKAQQAEAQETFDGWKQETDGLADELRADAAAAISKFGTDGAKQLLQADIGNHPELVKTFANVGALLREGKNHEGDGDPGGGKNLGAIYTTHT